MKVTKKKILAAGITVSLLALFIGVNSTTASFTSKDSAQNNFQAGQIKCSVVEKFEKPDSWNGEEYDKNVKVKNESTSKALIRAAIIPRWVNDDGTAFAGDVSFVSFSGTSDKWIKDESSGYYYYKETVDKDELTDEIIKCVKADVPENLLTRYNGKKLIVDVKAEAVLAKSECYKESWNNINSEEVIALLDGLCGD